MVTQKATQITKEECEFLGLEELSLFEKINLRIVSCMASIERIFLKPKEYSRENVRSLIEEDWDFHKEKNKLEVIYMNFIKKILFMWKHRHVLISDDGYDECDE